MGLIGAIVEKPSHNQNLWFSNHAQSFHFKESGWERIQNSQLCVTKSFKNYTLPSLIDWRADPFQSKSWRLYLHSLDWLHSFRYAIENHNDIEALKKSKEIIFDWWENNSQPEHADEMAWDDHATANRLANLCIWYNLFGDDFKEESQFFEIINFHCEMIYSFFENGHWIATNHAIFHIASLVNVNLVFGHLEQIIDTLELASVYLEEMIQTIIHDDSGFSVEQSLFYHQFVMNEFQPLLTLIESNPLMNSQGIRKCTKKMKSFLEVISTTDGIVPALGDTVYGFKVSEKYRPTVEHPSGTLVYEDSGIAIFRGFTNGLPNIGVFSFVKERTSHGHFNPLDFSLIMAGEELLVDAGGSYAYGEPFRFAYIISNLAHNVIRVNNENSKSASEYISSSIGKNSYVNARQSREGVEINRTVVSLSGECFIMFDNVELSDSCPIELLLHFSPTAVLSNIDGDEYNLPENGEFILHDKADFFQIKLSLMDSQVIMNSAFSSKVCSKIMIGCNDPTPQGWVTTGHRRVIPAPCMVVDFGECRHANSAISWVQKDSKFQILALSAKSAKVRIGKDEVCEVNCINGEVEILSKTHKG